MSEQLKGRPPFLQRNAGVSLVAIITCALASDALASRAEPGAPEREFSDRVAMVVDRIRDIAPGLIRDLPPDAKVAQWRN